MAVEGPAELISALEGRRFTDVLGTPESEWVDFKKAPYEPLPGRPLRLSPRGRWELAKDVAAFANANGGSLVLGYEETRDPNIGSATAGSYHPIPISRIDLAHYRDVLQQDVYPSLSNVELAWYADGRPPEGALLVNVRASEQKPHVLRRVVTEHSEQIDAVAIPTRNGDRTTWHSPERVHHLTRQAERMASTDFAAVEEHASERAEASRAYVLARHPGWDELPVYALQAAPFGGVTRLPNFYDEVAEALAQPSSLRWSGFNLRGLGGAVEVVAGSLVASGMPDVVGRLDPNGIFTVGVLATRDFLGWAINRDATQGTRINSTTLVEFTFEVCRFVEDVLRPRAAAQRWAYRVSCHRFQTYGVMLSAGRPPGFPRVGSPTSATADVWEDTIEAVNNPGADAFGILSVVYGLFGLPESAIPYARERAIDAAELLALTPDG